jgi:DNA gyrase/topoisomerase IV subunit B
MQEMSFIEAVRKRPGMYVGSTALFGFINYLVCPISLLLAQGAKHIDVTATDAFEITADVHIKVEQTDEGIVPFQINHSTSEGHSFEGTVLNALSQELQVEVKTTSEKKEWHFIKGVLASHKEANVQRDSSGTILRFIPDSSIFTICQLSPAIFESYFRRLSFLHKGVHFSLTSGNSKQEFFAAEGIADLFKAISSPYQLMHEPIRFIGHKGKLTLECALAYQSWSENHLWCFINNGRAVEGGTHEEGFLLALKRLKKKLNLPEHCKNGVVLVASIRYPDVVWEGCIKNKIHSPELKPMIAELVIDEIVRWLQSRPDVLTQIKQLQTFQFPDAWYT